jgi:probable HAF family extracellular repeat protein
MEGFVDSGGRFTTINVPGATNTEVFGINDLGQIVGTTWGLPGETNGQTEAFVESRGVFTCSMM